jgi:ubiquinone/menaquinone biosynthesis C-methylase UbiE
VLLDAYESTPERIEHGLTKDRPLVMGLAENLPFKDKSFDFVIASHVLEHSSDPERFLKELSRVAKGGYISIAQMLFSQRKRNSCIDIFRLLICPTCGNQNELERNSQIIRCRKCQSLYDIKGDTP